MLRFDKIEYGVFVLLVSLFIGIFKFFTFSKEAREHNDYSNQQNFKYNHPLIATSIDFAFSTKFPSPYNCQEQMRKIKKIEIVYNPTP